MLNPWHALEPGLARPLQPHSDGTKNGFEMAVAALYSRPTRWLRDLFRRKPRVESIALRDYRLAVTPLLERAECLYQQWREQMETSADSERVANIASTQSWEMASLGARLEACTPPDGLERLHSRCTKSFSPRPGGLNNC